ncbi:MAG: hypothetical protein IPN56_09930 [Chitinophagaceae bacterium]|nr:hypothetical protein [Chitinophagaceae bacterium]
MEKVIYSIPSHHGTLNQEKSYDKEKVTAFFTDWGPKAFDPAQYKEE